MKSYISRLMYGRKLGSHEYRALLSCSGAMAAELRDAAVRTAQQRFGCAIFVRGLIEISSYCKNNCLYCGIRRENKNASRYRMTPQEILECCTNGYNLGFRTFVLQGGEDPYFTDEVFVNIIQKIKGFYPDCAVTLSLGERSFESYKMLYDAGADRYLLRHETADKTHYEMLHPKDLSFENIDKFSTSSLVTRLTTDVTNVQQSFMMIIRTAIRSPFMFIFSVIMAFTVGGQMAFIFVIIIPILLFTLIIVARKAMPIFKKVFKKYDTLNGSVQENVQGMRVVKSFVREKYEIDKFGSANAELKESNMSAVKVMIFMSPVIREPSAPK